MKTLRQVLGEYTEEQLGQVAQWWGIGGTPDEGWRHHPGLLAQSMQDHIAARFAWGQLLEDERKGFHNALNFAASTRILHDVLLSYSRTLPNLRLAGQLVQPEVPLYAWEHFDAKTRKLCKWLSDEGGVVTMRAAREFTGFDNPTLAAAIHTLEQYSMAYDTFAGQERKLFVPREVLKHLKKAVAQSEPLQEDVPVGLAALDSAPESIRQGDTSMLYDLATIIGTMYQQNIEPTQAGKVPKRIANRLQPMLQGKPRVQVYYNEDLTIDMLFHISKELELVKLCRSSSDGVKPRYDQRHLSEQLAQK